MMVNLKKFMIILVLTLFIVQVAYASDLNESVSAEINDIIIDQIIEEDEVNEDSFSEEDVDETIIDLIVTDNSHPEESDDLNIIKTDEKSFQSNSYVYMNENLDDSLDNFTEFDETDEITKSFNVSYEFLSSYQLLVCNKLEVNFQSIYINDSIIQFSGIKIYNTITYDVLAYTNQNCNVLTHDVDKNIIFYSDKLNSKFIYCIDNSIIANSNNFHNYFSIISIFNYPQLSQYFISQYFFTGFYSLHMYDFFSVLNNRMNEVCSFRI